MFKRSMLLFCLVFFIPLISQDKKEGPADPLKDLQIVEQIQKVPQQYQVGFESLSKEDSEAFLRFISSDLLEGRDTGESGYAIASEFAAALFASWGLKPAGDAEALPGRGMFGPMSAERGKTPKRTFFQQVPLREKIDQKSELAFTETQGSTVVTYKPSENLDYTIQSSKPFNLDAPLVFIGYGLNAPSAGYNDLKGVDVKGKVVMVIEGKPENEKGGKRLAEMEKALQDNASPMQRRMLSNQFKEAQKAGALAVITVSADSTSWLNSLKPKAKQADSKPVFDKKGRSISLAMDEGMAMPWQVVPRLQISSQLADQLLKPYGFTLTSLKRKIDAELQPNSFEMKHSRIHIDVDVTEKAINCRNVLAFLEGSDPELKKELIVIGAHLDHLGKSGPYIFNGADDNGSGSVVVLQTAKAIMLNPVKPKRSILFALWTGEEKGLLGSRFYVAHPYKPMKDTFAYLNVDMASRFWDKASLGRMARMMRLESTDKLIEKVDLEKFALFTHYEDDKIAHMLRKSNEYVGLHLLLRGTKNSMGGSDHWPFGNANVPWVFFNTAMTEDYHQPSDELERCSFDLLQAVARLCYLTGIQLAGN